jgi:hypothetical protein
MIYDIENRTFIAKFGEFDTNLGKKSRYSSFVGKQSFVSFYVAPEYAQTVYLLTANSMEPVYTFEFNTKRSLPNDIMELDLSERLERFQNQPVVTCFTHFYETEDMVLLSYPLFDTEYGILDNLAKIDKNTNVVYNCRLGIDVDATFPFVREPLLIQDGVVVSAMLSTAVKRLQDNYPNIANLGPALINDESCYVLFFHKLK